MKISNSELKETEFKYYKCYYFDDVIDINDLDLDIVLLYEKIIQNF